MFQATLYHTEKDEDKKIHGDEELRCKPDRSKTRCMKFANYEKLNSEEKNKYTITENINIIEVILSFVSIVTAKINNK